MHWMIKKILKTTKITFDKSKDSLSVLVNVVMCNCYMWEEIAKLIEEQKRKGNVIGIHTVGLDPQCTHTKN